MRGQINMLMHWKIEVREQLVVFCGAIPTNFRSAETQSTREAVHDLKFMIYMNQ